MNNVQELEAAFRQQQEIATIAHAASKAYTRRVDAAMGDERISDEVIDEMEKEQKRLSNIAIHELNAANAALTAWKKAEREAAQLPGH